MSFCRTLPEELQLLTGYNRDEKRHGSLALGRLEKVAPRYFVWVKAVRRKYSNRMETDEQEGFEQKVSKVTKSWVPLLRGEQTATCVLFKDRTHNCKRSMGELS